MIAVFTVNLRDRQFHMCDPAEFHNDFLERAADCDSLAKQQVSLQILSNLHCTLELLLLCSSGNLHKAYLYS